MTSNNMFSPGSGYGPSTSTTVTATAYTYYARCDYCGSVGIHMNNCPSAYYGNAYGIRQLEERLLREEEEHRLCDRRLEKLLRDQYKLLGAPYEAPKKETPMSSLSEKIAKMRMSEPEKTLFKHNVIDKAGNLTPEGWEIVKQYTFDLVKDSLVKDLQDLDAAEDKKKK